MTTKSAWNALRASLRATAHGEMDTRRTAIDDDDDDEHDGARTATTPVSPSLDEDDTKDPSDGAKTIDEPLGDRMCHRQSGEAVRAARGFGNATDRPPRRG